MILSIRCQDCDCGAQRKV